MKKYIFRLILILFLSVISFSLMSKFLDRHRFVNTAMADLKNKDVVELMNRIPKDTVYRNKRIGDVSYVKYGGAGVSFNKTKFHYYILSHLPEGYAGDTSINVRTTSLTVSVIHSNPNKYWNNSWYLDYLLWYKGDIISSHGDINNPIMEALYEMPDLSKHGYR